MRVYLADTDPEVRHALRLVLEGKLGYQVVGEAAHTLGLASLVESATADLVLLEWDLPERVDARLLASLHSLASHPRVVVLSCRPDAQESALATGADAFVSKIDPPERLLAVVRQGSLSKDNGRKQRDGG